MYLSNLLNRTKDKYCLIAGTSAINAEIIFFNLLFVMKLSFFMLQMLAFFLKENYTKNL